MIYRVSFKKNRWNIIKWNGNKEFYSYYYDKVYFWSGNAEPTESQIPTINPKTCKIQIEKNKRTSKVLFILIAQIS
ncbi:hypothetical protein SDAV_001127 [Spiroplasma phoeniceum P40]|uniref:Spiroplasma plectrovirus-related protein n=1 Tax=Spiroplasma phoeniceum P40 TaxID=1276259 RepID=A0A345DPG1_9MOLU|nr:hypothetical protein SDAV_001127 [Spiroplasma phoeniceum P40]